MPKMYRLILAGNQKEKSFSGPYGMVTLPQGFETPESDYTKIYSDFFFEIPSANPDPIVEKWDKVLLNEANEEAKELAVLLKSEDQPVKKKAGRPFGTTKANGFGTRQAKGK